MCLRLATEFPRTRNGLSRTFPPLRKKAEPIRVATHLLVRIGATNWLGHRHGVLSRAEYASNRPIDTVAPCAL